MIRVLIADDHAILREGLRQLFSSTPDIVTAGEAANGAELLERLGHASFDLVLLDLSMPGRPGIELLKEIRRLWPQQRVLVLSMHPESQYAARALKAGASGYLQKASRSLQLIEAIRKVAAGGIYLPPSAAERVTADLLGLPAHTRLTDREYEILMLLTEGMAVADVARELHISAKTVSSHKAHLMEKLSLQSEAQLYRYAFEHGLLSDSGKAAGPDRSGR